VRRGPVAAPLTAGVMVLLAGCTGGERADAGPARLEMEWSGESKGRLAAPATAEWCDSLKVLEIRALSGDSGIAIALYPTDTIRSDSYAVMPPAKADSVPPAAAVALRYFGETSVKGYQGDSGRVLALFKGRMHLSVEDIETVAPAVLRHRIILNFDAHAEGQTAETILSRIIPSVGAAVQRA